MFWLSREVPKNKVFNPFVHYLYTMCIHCEWQRAHDLNTFSLFNQVVQINFQNTQDFRNKQEMVLYCTYFESDVWWASCIHSFSQNVMICMMYQDFIFFSTIDQFTDQAPVVLCCYICIGIFSMAKIDPRYLNLQSADFHSCREMTRRAHFPLSMGLCSRAHFTPSNGYSFYPGMCYPFSPSIRFIFNWDVCVRAHFTLSTVLYQV